MAIGDNGMLGKTDAPQQEVSEVSKPPTLGSLADSTPPTLSMEQISKLIKEQVEEEVAVRMQAIEDGDLKKEDVRPNASKQFNNFDKKLEIFGVDLTEALPGFVCRWFNDDGDRIIRQQMRGWALVSRKEIALNDALTPLNKDMGDYISVYVGSAENNQPMRAMLMKVDKDRYDQMMRVYEDHNDMIDEAINRGAIGPALQQGGYAGTDQGQVRIRYNPRGQVTASKPS